MKARETFKPGSKAHKDMIAAIEQGKPWFKDGIPYRPTHAREEGSHIIVDLEVIRS